MTFYLCMMGILTQLTSGQGKKAMHKWKFQGRHAGIEMRGKALSDPC